MSVSINSFSNVDESGSFKWTIRFFGGLGVVCRLGLRVSEVLLSWRVLTMFSLILGVGLVIVSIVE